VNKLATDGSGRVTVDSKTGYELTAPYDPAKTAASQGSVNALPTAQQIEDEVLNALLSGHTIPGSVAAGIAAAGAAGDPWATDLTNGSYTDPDTAGYIIRTYLDARVSQAIQSITIISPASSDDVIECDIGDRIRLDGDWPTEPDTVTFRLRHKTDAIAEIEWVYDDDPEVVKDGVGSYYVLYEPTVAGTHFYRWEGTGPPMAAEEREFSVRKSKIIANA
jgi:hypothetical protein